MKVGADKKKEDTENNTIPWNNILYIILYGYKPKYIFK